MVMFWAPHWIFSEIEMKWVEALPPYEEGCDTDPAKGPNPDKVGDCSFPKANVSKVAWKGMKDKWPAAWKVLEAMSIDNASQQKIMFEVDSVRARPQGSRPGMAGPERKCLAGLDCQGEQLIRPPHCMGRAPIGARPDLS